MNARNNGSMVGGVMLLMGAYVSMFVAFWGAVAYVVFDFLSKVW